MWPVFFFVVFGCFFVGVFFFGLCYLCLFVLGFGLGLGQGVVLFFGVFLFNLMIVKTISCFYVFVFFAVFFSRFLRCFSGCLLFSEVGWFDRG